MATKAKTTETKPAPSKKAPVLTPASVLVFDSPRKCGGNGPKTQLLALVKARKRMTVAALTKAGTEELELPADKVRKWVGDFVRFGRVKIA